MEGEIYTKIFATTKIYYRQIVISKRELSTVMKLNIFKTVYFPILILNIKNRIVVATLKSKNPGDADEIILKVL